ncbi:MAG: hypothetical protein VB142_00065 [Burkholderia sp.]
MQTLDQHCLNSCSCLNRSMFVRIIMKSLPWGMLSGFNALLLHFDLETAYA